ncbi:hypothetical protein CRM22_007228 [Opisthorchis felineus]|uniref:G-protein coupled receptors family 2 profile 2 domain-containing protein n=1 Tax=Opisthorchis felineus TaxID=147828 RepID=A0A4S2LGX4_OPIFE|nr:hypothetical protein CRM22_007228 [Opisthorchis felineus]
MNNVFVRTFEPVPIDRFLLSIASSSFPTIGSFEDPKGFPTGLLFCVLPFIRLRIQCDSYVSDGVSLIYREYHLHKSFPFYGQFSPKYPGKCEDQLGSAIHVISEEESLRAIEVTRAECLRNRSIDGKPIQQLDFAIIMKVDFEFRKQAMRGNQDFCLAEFASAVCWPTTPGNHTVTMPCPHYVPGVRKHGQVSRRCFWSHNVDEETNGSAGHWQFSDVEFRDCLAVVESSSGHVKILIHIGTAGYAISTLSLVFAITIMVRFRRLRCTRNTIHVNLFSAILLRCLVHFMQKTLDTNIQWFCRLLTTLTTLTVTATHSWVFVEALYLHNTVLIHIFHSTVSSIVGYIITGWVTPIILTAVWVVLRLTITTGTTCWILDNTPHSPSRLLLSLSPVVMLLFNLAFSINVFRLVLVKMKSQTSGETSRVKDSVQP